MIARGIFPRDKRGSMKYIVILGDGMADYKRGPLGEHTPLELAHKPHMDELAKMGSVGLIRTVDPGMKPGSDVANLSVIGYDPRVCYTGRSPLEALSIGVPFTFDDTVFRVNLVTLGDSEDGSFEKLKMLDYSAGEISTAEAHELMAAIDTALSDGKTTYHGGTSYRNCAILHDGKCAVEFTPPHDISGKVIADYLPQGEGADYYADAIKKSMEILKDHPVNQARVAAGKNPATAIWFWGKGTKPQLEDFRKKYGLRAAMISAVDLLKGIAKGANMDVIEVPGATGTLSSNFVGKANACLKALDDHDYVYVHMEAPDECGHQGDAQGKIKAVEKVDEVLGIVLDGLKKRGEDYCIAVLPDHATPLVVRTHTSEPIPFIVYRSDRPAHCGIAYTEEEAQKGLYLDNGRALINFMLNG